MARDGVISYSVGSETDVGSVRDENQDAVGYFQTKDGEWTLLVVCDGMGGHAAGQLASSLAVATLSEVFNRQIAEVDAVATLEQAIRAANAAIFQAAQESPEKRGMGTTVAALAVSSDQAFVAHVGDSRVYRIRPGTIERMTKDHSAVQRMVDGGLLTEEQAAEHPDANILSKCVGAKGDLDPDIRGPIAIDPGDRFLLCSDGLVPAVQETIVAAMAMMYRPQDAVEKLIALANDRGGDDNISVQIMHRDDAHPPTGVFEPDRFQVVAAPMAVPSSSAARRAPERVTQPSLTRPPSVRESRTSQSAPAARREPRTRRHDPVPEAGSGGDAPEGEPERSRPTPSSVRPASGTNARGRSRSLLWVGGVGLILAIVAVVLYVAVVQPSWVARGSSADPSENAQPEPLGPNKTKLLPARGVNKPVSELEQELEDVVVAVDASEDTGEEPNVADRANDEGSSEVVADEAAASATGAGEDEEEANGDEVGLALDTDQLEGVSEEDAVQEAGDQTGAEQESEGELQTDAEEGVDANGKVEPKFATTPVKSEDDEGSNGDGEGE